MAQEHDPHRHDSAHADGDMREPAPLGAAHPTDAPASAPAASRGRRARWPMVVGGVFAAIVVTFGLCEVAGWPFLVAPMQRWLTGLLERQVTFTGEGRGQGVKIHLLGSVRIDAASIEIAAPAWSKTPHMVLAHAAELRLGYGDLWRAHEGHPLSIRTLRADQLDLQLERLEDGRASWQFGKPKPETDTAERPRLPSFADLRVRDGTLLYRDAVMEAELDARFALVEHGSEVGPAGQVPASAASQAATVAVGASAAASALAAHPPAATASAPSGLQLSAKGTYRKLPLRIDLLTSSVLALAGDKGATVVQPVTLDATVGRSRMTFRGTATDPIHLLGLRGRFEVEGPSLAAVGDFLGVTLPTTNPFKTDGFVEKDGDLWKVLFSRATIGDSRLAGAFTYDRRPKVPLLAGRLTGSRLLLRDLGPAFGTTPHASGASGPRAAAEAPVVHTRARAARAAPSKAATPDSGASAPAGPRVIPDRRFDLPSLHAMDANVLIDIAHLDLGSTLLAPFEPLRGHLRLADAVLTITDIDARTAQGRLAGSFGVDGRKPQAIWTTDLRLAGVQLDQWLHLARKGDKPPFISGTLDGEVKVDGRGSSTAEMLATLNGGMRFHLRRGTVSHLVVEIAGIDLAQALGMVVKGDDSLTIDCNIADFTVEKGVARPRVFVLDNRDSTVWVDGSASLADETLDLVAVVSPKDASPLTLRTPIHVKGTFSAPSVSLEKSKLGLRLGAATLLALINPVAAIVPFIDPGAKEDARREAAQCAQLAERENPSKVPAATAARTIPVPRPPSGASR
jgi:uncharacterized protein involved in outer membrane biogenesis